MNIFDVLSETKLNELLNGNQPAQPAQQPVQPPQQGKPGAMGAVQATQQGQFPLDTTTRGAFGLTQDLSIVMNYIAAVLTSEQITDLMRKIFPIWQQQKQKQTGA